MSAEPSGRYRGAATKGITSKTPAKGRNKRKRRKKKRALKQVGLKIGAFHPTLSKQKRTRDQNGAYRDQTSAGGVNGGGQEATRRKGERERSEKGGVGGA